MIILAYIKHIYLFLQQN